MARTWGSRDAWRMNSSTELENDSSGCVHQHVALANDREQVDRLVEVGAGETVLGDRHPRLVLQLRRSRRVHRPQPAQVERHVSSS